MPGFDRTVAAFDYLPPADQLILPLKQGGRTPLAAVLGRLLVEALHDSALPVRDRPACVVPIPASPISLTRRGFNPAGLIARSIANIMDIPLNVALLTRSNAATKQSQSQASQRRRQLHGLFHCSSADDVAPLILLVDDVMTTGSTLSEAARVLKQAGAVTVLALVAARRPWHREGGSP